ncbi:MAG: YcxB family protein [Ruminococcus sp.]|nr:YcxB family protein [Ruminococcus sp.]
MIRAKVVYTPEHIKQLIKCRSIIFYIIMIGVTLHILITTFSIICIPFLSAISDTPIPEGFTSNLIISIFASLFIIGIDIWAFFLYPYYYVKKRRKKYGDTPAFYELDDNSVKINCTGAGFDEQLNFTYDKLDKARETKGYFLLYPQKNSAYIIGKHEITEGTPDDLRNLLKSKLGKKFK